jgi:hypothetical protein
MDKKAKFSGKVTFEQFDEKTYALYLADAFVGNVKVGSETAKELEKLFKVSLDEDKPEVTADWSGAVEFKQVKDSPLHEIHVGGVYVRKLTASSPEAQDLEPLLGVDLTQGIDPEYRKSQEKWRDESAVRKANTPAEVQQLIQDLKNQIEYASPSELNSIKVSLKAAERKLQKLGKQAAAGSTAVASDMVTKVARDFANGLKKELSAEEMSEVVALNRGEQDDSICHSHDFCDANAAMAEAFKKNGQEAPGVLDESDEAMELWNSAWDYAKQHEFWLDEAEAGVHVGNPGTAAVASDDEEWITPPDLYSAMMESFTKFEDSVKKAVPSVHRNYYSRTQDLKAKMAQVHAVLVELGDNVQNRAPDEMESGVHVGNPGTAALGKVLVGKTFDLTKNGKTARITVRSFLAKDAAYRVFDGTGVHTVKASQLLQASKEGQLKAVGQRDPEDLAEHFWYSLGQQISKWTDDPEYREAAFRLSVKDAAALRSALRLIGANSLEPAAKYLKQVADSIVKYGDPESQRLNQAQSAVGDFGLEKAFGALHEAHGVEAYTVALAAIAKWVEDDIKKNGDPVLLEKLWGLLDEAVALLENPVKSKETDAGAWAGNPGNG